MRPSLHSPTTAELLAVQVPVGDFRLDGWLAVPPDPRGVVIVASADGDGIYLRSNAHIAARLARCGFATLLIDLLTPAEAAEDAETSALRFNQSLVASRLARATCWVQGRSPLIGLEIGYVAGGLCAGSALATAAVLPIVRAVVCRGARFEHAQRILPRVTAEVLLLVGEGDAVHLRLNREALSFLPDTAQLEVIEGGGHILDGRADLEEVVERAARWFSRTLANADETLEPALAGA